MRADVSLDDLGTYWLHSDGHVYKLVNYCDRPSATWARVEDPSVRRGGAVGSPLAREFLRLIPEAKE